MKEMLKINLNEIEPYIRLVQEIKGKSDDYYVPWRILYDFELMLITNGSFRIETKNEKFDLFAGDFIVIPPFLRHKQLIPDGCECSYYAVHLDFYRENSQDDFSYKDVYIYPCERHSEIGFEIEELSERHIYEPVGINLSVVVKIKNYIEFLNIFKRLKECFDKNTDISQLETRAQAMLLIAAFFREVDGAEDSLGYSEKIVRIMADYMSKHFSERVDLVAFSEQYGFNSNYFRKLFKQVLNHAPNEYLINIRINEAKKLLKLGRYTVQMVSEMVGYDDVHYFTRLFKKKEGVSPAQYGKDQQDEKI